MTKAFSILHRAAALLVALCLLVGMALPVYAAEDEALFFDAGSETIPTIPAADTSSEGVEPAQEPIVSDLETIPDEGDTPPTANEPGTEAGDTVNNTAAVPNNDGKTQEAAENQTPAADTDTAPADPALTNKTPADTSDTAAAPNHAINAEEATAAKTNTEQDVLFADGDNPNEEDTMPADDSPDNDDANTPDTIADTSVSTGFIPATTTIYFEDDGRMLVDDTTPDGRYADVDGKLLDHNPYEDETAAEDETDAAEDETEADTEEETTGSSEKESAAASVKETTAAVKETVETTKANPQPTQASAVNSGNLKLNADTLQEAHDNGGTTTYEKTDLFDGSTGKLTMGDVYNCLAKYGKTEWVSQKLPYELKVGNLKVWILPGDNWNTTGLVIKDASQYFEVLKKKALPDNVQFAIEFDSAATDKLDINKVRRVNGN